MKRFLLPAAEAFFVIFVVFMLLEITLRLFPSLIPLSLLVNFQPDLRSAIAKIRGLPTMRSTYLFERDDGGPPLRLYKPHTVMPFTSADPGIVRSVSMDKNGFCNTSPAAELERVDVIVIGDSFTWCVGVKPEDAWWSRFAAASGHSAYSLGIGGIGPYDALQLLKRFGLSKSPKVVVLNIFGGNDLLSAVLFHEYRRTIAERGGRAHLVDACVGLSGPVCIFYLFKEGPVGRNGYAVNLALSAAGGVFLRMHDAPQLAQYNVEYEERLMAGKISMNAFDEVLQNFVLLGREAGFRPVVSFTPQTLAYWGVPPDRIVNIWEWPMYKQRSYFAAKASELGYDFVDFTPALSSAMMSNDELLYFPFNRHLTAAGHAVVGRALAATIFGSISR